MEPSKENASSEDVAESQDDFSTTQWSVVLEAGLTNTPECAGALEKLCVRYWPPVRSYIQRQIEDENETEDLTQSFFADLLKAGSLKKADRAKGKFREFLQTASKDFIQLKQQRCDYRTSPAGNAVTLNEAAPEIDRRQSGEASPETLFDKEWALVILITTLNRLKEEYSVDKKIELFERLKPGLTGRADHGWHATLAAEMNMNEGALRVALHRLRRRFGELLRKEVARTVSDPAQVDEEIRHLFSVMEAGGHLHE